MSGPSELVSIVPFPSTSWKQETTTIAVSQPAIGSTVVANVKVSPSFVAGDCVGAAIFAPSTEAILMLEVAVLPPVLPPPLPLPARAGVTARIRVAANATMNAVCRFIAASPFAGRTTSGRAAGTGQEEDRPDGLDPDAPFG